DAHRATASRSSSTPASAAARAPIVPAGSTIAAHSPAEVAAAASVSATVVDPEPGAPPTAIVLPRWTLPAGRSAPIGSRTGSRRARASWWSATCATEIIAMRCSCANNSRYGKRGRRAVVVQDLADDGDRRQAGEPRRWTNRWKQILNALTVHYGDRIAANHCD